MITIEGIKINVSVTALNKGQEFLVEVNTQWDMPNPDRKVIGRARRAGLLGRLLYKSEDSYAEAQKSVVAAVTKFEEDVIEFISDYNA